MASPKSTTPEAYYLEWREDGQRKRLSVGRDPDTARQRQVRKLAELRALSQGLLVEDIEEEANKNQVQVAVREFLDEVQLTKQDKTWRGYKIALRCAQARRSRRWKAGRSS